MIRWNSLFPKKRLLKVALLVLLAFYAVPRVLQTVRFPGWPHVPNANSDFPSFLAALLPSANAATIDRAHPGAVHYSAGPAFLADLWFTPTTSLAGYPLDARDWDPTEEDKATLFELLCNPVNFSRYGGPKLCGGFHPDLGVSLETSSDDLIFLGCSGCSEAIVVRGGEKHIADFSARGSFTYTKLVGRPTSDETRAADWNRAAGPNHDWQVQGKPRSDGAPFATSTSAGALPCPKPA